MKDINGISVQELPIENLKRVYDLWEYDGPILSHMTDGVGDNFLFYWVDNDSEFNRWLVWQVEIGLILDYVNRKVDFSKIFKAAKFYFSTDIDGNFDYTNVKILQLANIPVEYVPEDGLMYEDDVPEVYLEELISVSPGFNVRRLRKTGYSFKLAKANSGAPISVEDGGRFLTAVDESIKAYAIHDYFTKEKDNIVDITHFYKKIVPLLRDACQPLIVDNLYGSFEVVLNVENLEQVHETVEITRWKKNVIADYYNDVVAIDYNSVAGQDSLISKFPDPEVRRNIIKPIADFLKKADCSFVSKKVGKNETKIHSRLSNKSYSRLELRSAKEKKEPDIKTTFLTMIVEVDLENGKPKMNKQALDKGTLFQELTDTVPYRFRSAKNASYEVEFKEDIVTVVRKNDDGSSTMESAIPHLSIVGKTSAEALSNFTEALIDHVVKLSVSTMDDEIAEYDQIVEELIPLG